MHNATRSDAPQHFGQRIVQPLIPAHLPGPVLPSRTLHPPVVATENTFQHVIAPLRPNLPTTNAALSRQHLNTSMSNGYDWKLLIEERMNSFDSKIDGIMDFLKSSQNRIQQNQLPMPQNKSQPQHSLNNEYQTRSELSQQDFLLSSTSSGIRENSILPSNSPPLRPPHPLQPASLSSTSPSSSTSSPSSSITHSPKVTHSSVTTNSNLKRPHAEDHLHAASKRHKVLDLNALNHPPTPKDFRDGFITKKNAKELFKFFDTYISQQLFGFEISKFKINEIWDTCPVLVCAVCAIASIHHPKLCKKSEQLQVYLRELCGTLFFLNRPKLKSEAYNTIVALILCSFWLSDSQMFTGLALQIAKEYGFNKSSNPNNEKGQEQSTRNSKEDLKLWYLLYVLDGQQSMAFHRDPLFNGQEYTLKHSKELLISEKSGSNGGDEGDEGNEGNEGNDHHHHHDHDGNADLDDSKIKQPSLSGTTTTAAAAAEARANTSGGAKYKAKSDSEIQSRVIKQQLTDLRLVSQVEYHQALNEAFRGDAWNLLMPASFGIPSKSNLELDKWMVSWTVLLAPGNYGAVWSSKSTLIYYNFAKMHINSSAVRKLAINPTEDGSFPTLEENLIIGDKKGENINTLNKIRLEDNKPLKLNKSGRIEDDGDTDDSETSDEEDEDDEDDFISNKELLSPDEAAINANIALNAAHTVINLVITDKDILDNLRYVPVHIHIMLYYAALLLINPPSRSNNVSFIYTAETYYDELLDNLRVVNLLRKRIYNNLPIDSKFGTRLIKRLESLELEKLATIQQFVAKLLDSDIKSSMEKKVNALLDLSGNIEELIDANDSANDSSKASTPRLEKISAWPGSNHGHP